MLDDFAVFYWKSVLQVHNSMLWVSVVFIVYFLGLDKLYWVYRLTYYKVMKQFDTSSSFVFHCDQRPALLFPLDFQSGSHEFSDSSQLLIFNLRTYDDRMISTSLFCIVSVLPVFL